MMSRQAYLKQLIETHQQRLAALKRPGTANLGFERLQALPPANDLADDVETSPGVVQKLLRRLGRFFAANSVKPFPDTSSEIQELETIIAALQAELAAEIESESPTKPPPQPPQRATLSPDILSQEMQQALNQAAALRRAGRPALTPALLLLACLKIPETAAHQLLRQRQQTDSFDWAKLEQYVTKKAGEQADRDGFFDFIDDKGQTVPLGHDILLILDKALDMAEVRSEPDLNSGDILQVMAGTKADLGQLLNLLGFKQGTPSQTAIISSPGSFSKLRLKSRRSQNVSRYNELMTIHFIADLELDQEIKTQIQLELQWLFAAVEHYLKIQGGDIHFSQPVPIAIPPTAAPSQTANNCVLTFAALLPPDGPFFERQIEHLLRIIDIHLKNLKVLRGKQAQLDSSASGLALMHDIDSNQQGIIQNLQTLAQLMPQIYGVTCHSFDQLLVK